MTPFLHAVICGAAPVISKLRKPLMPSANR